MVSDQVTRQELAKAYEKVLVNDPARSLKIKTDIDYKIPETKEIFNAAARGEKISDAGLERYLEKITGRDVSLIRDRTDPLAQMITRMLGNPKETPDYKNDIAPVYALYLKQSYGLNHTRQDRADLAAALQNLAQKIDTPKEQIEKNFRQERFDTLGRKFFDESSKTNPRDAALEPLGIRLLQKAANGYLNGKASLYDHINESRLIEEGLEKFFKKNPSIDRTRFMTEFDPSSITVASKRLSAEINDQKTAFAAAADTNAYQTTLIVPDSPGMQMRTYFSSMFRYDDMPDKPPPMTKEQFEFIVSLHEAEHATQTTHRLNFNGLSNEKRIALSQHAIEIDADGAILDALRDMGQNEIAQYWLAMRNIRSFCDPDHNTALFLRSKKAGYEIDIEKFADAQAALGIKLGTYMDVTDKDLTTRQVRGAMEDILKKDIAAPDGQKPLDNFERSQIVQFIQDCETVGYPADPGYPKPREPIPADPLPATKNTPATAASAP